MVGKRPRREKFVTGLIVHEWAERTGGAEQVLEQFVADFPDADIQVLWNDAGDRFDGAYESWLARTPLRKSKALALPFMLPTWRHLPARKQYDWMLVSSHLFAHHARIRAASQPPKLVYAHTPARYVWEPELDRRGENLAVKLASSVLRPLDRARALEATDICANSEFTRLRIQRTWGRDARVIYPPVDTTTITGVDDWRTQLNSEELSVVAQLPESFILGASRFVEYKRLHLVIEAGKALDLPVVIAGRGPDEKRLRALASETNIPVHFIIGPSTPLLRTLFQRSLAFVFPAIEDFGIMPIEAMATGTPVVVPEAGGASESVALTSGGAVFSENSPRAWRDAVDQASKVDRERLRLATTIFSSERFRSEIRSWVSSFLPPGPTP